MGNKGFKCYKEQLLIALELSKEVTPKELIEQKHYPKTTVYDIKKKLDKGWKPDLSEAAIDAAPLSPGFGKKSDTPAGAQKDVKHGGSSSEKLVVEEPEKKPFQPQSGLISLSAVQIKGQYTPIMYMARLAATDKWGWAPEIIFEDFIDVCLYHFFKDRGITLQGYIVDAEVNKPENGEIKELKETVQELVALVKGDKK